MKLDNFWVGTFIGIVVPIISFFIFMSVVFETHSNYSETLRVLKQANMSAKALTACIVPTFFIFYLFYWRKLNRAAQGVVFSALLLTFSLVVYSEFL